MAVTQVQLKGYFGVKEAFNVAMTSGVPTKTWYAGMLFQYAGKPYSYVGDYVTTGTSSCAAGWPIAGVACENSADYSSAAYGMTSPSGSKVTLIHGHSRFSIPCDGTNKCYESDVENAGIVNNLLFCSANGKWTITSGAAKLTSHPIGMLTTKPTAANSYTLGVVLFG